MEKKWYENKWVLEAARIIPLALLVLGILVPNEGLRSVVFGSGIVLLGVLLAHGIRKIFFPYLDVKALVDKVKEDAMASAIVIAALMYLLAGIIQAFVVLLR